MQVEKESGVRLNVEYGVKGHNRQSCRLREDFNVESQNHSTNSNHDQGYDEDSED